MWHETISFSTNILKKNHIFISFNKYSKNSWHFTKILNFRSEVYFIRVSFSFAFCLGYSCSSIMLYEVNSFTDTVKSVLMCASVQKQLEVLDHIID